MRIFFSAGEASGDAYAAALVRELRKLDPTLEFEGIGGKLLAAEGAKVHADSSAWGAISIVESVAVFFRILFGSRPAAKKLEGERGVLVPIDFGFFNIRLCRLAKKLGWKILYFVPPGSWRRDRQGRDVAELADEIVTPFSWSAELLNQMGGAKAYWYGHPLKQLARDAEGTGGRSSIAILPGSRTHEVEENLPVIAETLRVLDHQEPVEFAVAPTYPMDRLKSEWTRLAPGRPDRFTEGDVIGVLRRARVAIVCSGTATLQAVIAKTPQVVIYRVSKLMEFEGRLLGFKKKVKFIALPNIFLGRMAVPELIQHDASPEAISKWVRDLESDGKASQDQKSAYDEIDAMLGGDDAITRAAERIIGLSRR